MKRKNAWTTYSDNDLKKLETISKNYISFLDSGKTERECVTEAVKLAEKHGYRNFAEVIANGEKLKAGDCVYSNCMGKAIMFFMVGKQPLENGLNIVGAHIDSPRIDLKQNPLYEEAGLAYLDTHYYGGIKKYQWVAMPLAMHGVVAKKDGSLVNIVIGEDPGDPVVGISDLLPHLAADQLGKKGSLVIEGEALDVLIGSKPNKADKADNNCDEKDKDNVKESILAILKEKYDIEEEDFLSAEIEIVPAGGAREFGLDRSMIIGYGHDDRVCAYAQLEAIFDITEVPEHTICCILADKEEIGSVGATGMNAKYFENAVAELINATGEYCDLKLRRTLAASSMLSCDVSAGFDPLFASAFERKNSAYLGRGVCFNKYTGSRGKGGSNDANAEYIGSLRKLMDDAGVNFQTAELGKVDQGGGGTIAYICAAYGMNVIDSGVAVLSMHAPWEIISKADLYEAVKAYHAFLINA